MEFEIECLKRKKKLCVANIILCIFAIVITIVGIIFGFKGGDKLPMLINGFSLGLGVFWLGENIFLFITIDHRIMMLELYYNLYRFISED